MRKNNLPQISLALSCAALCLSSINGTYKDSRIKQLEQDRDIYKSRFENWSNRAQEDEEKMSVLQDRLDELADGKVYLEPAGTFLCTAYCTEKRSHICGTGDGVTASGTPVQADLTVAADQTIFPYGTVLYIEGIGIRVVQDRGADIQGQHLDVAVAGTHEAALNWDGYGEHRVWIVRETE